MVRRTLVQILDAQTEPIYSIRSKFQYMYTPYRVPNIHPHIVSCPVALERHYHCATTRIESDLGRRSTLSNDLQVGCIIRLP